MEGEDDPRFPAAAEGANEQEPAGGPGRDSEARRTGLQRALEDVGQIAVEASELLRTEGLKPARLHCVPRDARSYPLVGRAFSKVACGYGWHVVRGVVVGTDGRLWARTQVHGPTPQKDLGAWRLEVEPPDGPVGLPPPIEYNGVSLHVVRRVSDDEYVKADFIDRLLDGYARLLILHHAGRG